MLTFLRTTTAVPRSADTGTGATDVSGLPPEAPALIAAYVVLFKDEHDREPNLTHAQVWKAITSIEGEGDDAQAARLEAMEDAEPELTGDAPAPTDPNKVADMLTDAEKVGAKLAANAAFLAHVTESAKASDKKRREAIEVLCDLRDTFGWDNIAAIFPVPKSEKGTNFPDRMQEQNDEGKWVWTSFYAKVADTLPDVTAAMDKVALLQAAKDSKATEANPYQAWHGARIESEMARLRGWRSGTVTLLRKAVSVYLKLTEIADKLPKVRASIQWEDESLPIEERVFFPTNKPLYIQDANSQGHVKPFSVSSFLQLKVDTAVQNGGTFGALLNTVGKKTPAAGQGKTSKYKVPTNIPQYVDNLQGIAGYADYADKANGGDKRTAAFLAACAGEKGEENVLAVISAYNSLDYLMSQLGDRATLVAAKRAGDLTQDAKDILARRFNPTKAERIAAQHNSTVTK